LAGGSRAGRRAGFPPEPLIDLALDPSEAQRLLATSEGGLYESQDESRSLQRLGNPSGLLAWPMLEQLYLAAPGGGVLLSSDGGREWQSVGQIGGERPRCLRRARTNFTLPFTTAPRTPHSRTC
jgi:hypothetical protein